MDNDSSEYLRSQQYKTDANLSARIRLHRDYSVNKHGWHQWVFEQFPRGDSLKVLEVGCGVGTLWKVNLPLVPHTWEITLSDFSDGMLSQARQTLGQHNVPFRWQVADVRELPFDDCSFDFAIANHMLYHVPEREMALHEVARVLRPNGLLFASTNGRDHMREVDELVCRYSGKSCADSTAAEFGLETGAHQLKAVFSSVDLRIYPDSLSVTNSQALVDYIRSMPVAKDIDEMHLATMEQHVQRVIQKEGTFSVTKSAGLFICEV